MVMKLNKWIATSGIAGVIAITSMAACGVNQDGSKQTGAAGDGQTAAVSVALSGGVFDGNSVHITATRNGTADSKYRCVSSAAGCFNFLPGSNGVPTAIDPAVAKDFANLCPSEDVNESDAGGNGDWTFTYTIWSQENCTGTQLTGDEHNFTCFAESDILTQANPNESANETLPPGNVVNTVLCLSQNTRKSFGFSSCAIEATPPNSTAQEVLDCGCSRVGEAACTCDFDTSTLPAECSFDAACNIVCVVRAPSATGSPVAYVRSDGVNAVVHRSSTAHINELRLSSSGWFWADLSDLAHVPNTANTAGNPSPYVRSDGINAVVYRGVDKHIHELRLTSSGWVWADLSAQNGAPDAEGDPAAYVRSDGTNAIVYQDFGKHIQELRLTTSSGWVPADLSHLAGAFDAHPNYGPAAYVRSDGISAVVYTDLFFFVEALSLTSSGWAPTPLSSLPFAPFALGNPHGYVRDDGINAVVYLDIDRHITELRPGSSGPSSSPWLPADLSDLAHVPNTDFAVGNPSPYVRSDHVNAVVYRDRFNDIQELSLSSGSGWFSADLSSLAGAPVAAGDPFGYVRSDHVNAVVYQGFDKHINELRLSSSGWFSADLSHLAGETP
jgi:hypothetical protein